MPEPASPPRSARDRRLRAGLLALKLTGLAGVLGGLAALVAMWLFGPVPDDVAGWQTLIELMRAVFFSCFFAGLIVVILAGAGLWLMQRRALRGARWLHLKIALLAVVVPTLHFTARGRVLRFYDAVEDGRLDDAAALWNQVGVAFLVAFVVLLGIAAFARVKPRLGGGKHGTTDERR